MDLLNGRTYPGLPEKALPYFRLASDCDIESEDLLCIGSAMLRTVEHKDFQNKRKRRLTLIFTDSETIQMKFSEDSFAEQGNLAFYKYPQFKSRNPLEKLIIVTEEIVHHFWDTDEETFVKDVVCEIVNSFDFNVSYDHENKWYLYQGQALPLR